MGNYMRLIDLRFNYIRDVMKSLLIYNGEMTRTMFPPGLILNSSACQLAVSGLKKSIEIYLVLSIYLCSSIGAGRA